MTIVDAAIIAVVALALAVVVLAAFAFVIYSAAMALRSLGEPFENDEPDDNKESEE